MPFALAYSIGVLEKSKETHSKFGITLEAVFTGFNPLPHVTSMEPPSQTFERVESAPISVPARRAITITWTNPKSGKKETKTWIPSAYHYPDFERLDA